MVLPKGVPAPRRKKRWDDLIDPPVGTGGQGCYPEPQFCNFAALARTRCSGHGIGPGAGGVRFTQPRPGGPFELSVATASGIVLALIATLPFFRPLAASARGAGRSCGVGNAFSARCPALERGGPPGCWQSSGGGEGSPALGGAPLAPGRPATGVARPAVAARLAGQGHGTGRPPRRCCLVLCFHSPGHRVGGGVDSTVGGMGVLWRCCAVLVYSFLLRASGDSAARAAAVAQATPAEHARARRLQCG